MWEGEGRIEGKFSWLPAPSLLNVYHITNQSVSESSLYQS